MFSSEKSAGRVVPVGLNVGSVLLLDLGTGLGARAFWLNIGLMLDTLSIIVFLYCFRWRNQLVVLCRLSNVGSVLLLDLETGLGARAVWVGSVEHWVDA